MAMRCRVDGFIAYLRTMSVFLLAWWALSAWTRNPVLLPSPWSVMATLVELAVDVEVFRHAAVSAARMLLSLVLASGLAVSLGLVMRLHRRFDRLVDRVIELLRPILSSNVGGVSC